MLDPRRLLIVEDDPANAALLREWLDGHEVVHASRMSLAERHLSVTRFDAIVLDLGLPDSQGSETFRRARMAAPRTPAIVLTGGHEAERAAALGGGIHEFLLKSEATPELLERAIHNATVRARLASELEHSAGLALEVFDGLSEAVVAIDRAGLLRYVNRAAEAFGARLREEVLGRDIFESFPAMEGTEFETALRAAMATGEAQFCRDFYEPSGVWLEARFMPSAIGVVAFVRDITAQRTADRELHLRTELLSRVANAVIATDTAGLITFWNEAAEKLYGWQAAEVIGRPIVDVTPVDVDAASAIMKSLSEGKPWAGEFEVVRRDGTRFWASVIDAPIIGSDGEVAGIVGVSTDVSDRRAAEEAAHAMDVRFRALVEGSADVIAVLDADNLVTYVSPAVTTMLGFEREELLGASPVSLIHPEDTAKTVAKLDRVRTEPSGYVEGQFRVRQRDGGWRIVSCRATNRLDDDAVAGVVLNLHDITARRQAEQREELQRVLLSSIAEDRPLADTLTLMAEHLQRMLEVQAVSVVAADESGELAAAGTAGLAKGLRKAIVANAQRALAGPSEARSGLEQVDVASEIPDPALAAETVRAGFRAQWRVTVPNHVTDLGLMDVFMDQAREAGEEERRTLDVAVGLAAVAIERDRIQRNLNFQALHDPLTGLPNRYQLEQRITTLLAEDRSGGQHVAVLLLDLDHFKILNESVGHPTGDALLRAIGSRMRRALPPAALVARFSGDMFAVVTPGVVRDEEAAQLGEMTRSVFGRPFRVEGRLLSVTASIGVCLGRSGETTAEEMLQHADSAVYRAKETGRDRYEVFDSGMRERAQARFEMTNGLRQAIPLSELAVHYQPQVEIATGRIVGLEALARWRHRADGYIPPSEFIPLAEEAGLIGSIGEWVMRRACDDLAAWQAKGFELPMCLNVSGLQLADPAFPMLVQSALDESGIDPSMLTVEVTESVLVEDGDALASCLVELRRLGVMLGVDDFGTGHSSLLYLKRFPVSMLKIDRSFVSDLDRSTDRAIVRAIVALAAELGVTTVAEGVETTEQARQLTELGCTVAQGYLFARPAEEATISALLETGDVGRSTPSGGPKLRLVESVAS
ncbi:MAG TPA: EAL domain-containing protein [Candidatus Limnocylindrales bacterium]|nr:EAL domain-containing protein [Candidatus Limnocylindrales bacterium]